MKRKIIPLIIVIFLTSSYFFNNSDAGLLFVKGETGYWIILEDFSGFNLTIDDPKICSSNDVPEISFSRCSDLTNQSFHEQYIYNLDASFNRTYYNITIDFKYDYDDYWDIGEVEIAFMHRNDSVASDYENIVAMFRMGGDSLDNSTSFKCYTYSGHSLSSFGRWFETNPPLHGVTFTAILNGSTTYHAIKKAVHDELLVHYVFDMEKNQSIDYIVVNYWTSEVNGNFNATLTNFYMSLKDPNHVPLITTPESTSPSVNISYSGVLALITTIIIFSVCKKRKRIQ